MVNAHIADIVLFKYKEQNEKVLLQGHSRDVIVNQHELTINNIFNLRIPSIFIRMLIHKKTFWC